MHNKKQKINGRIIITKNVISVLQKIPKQIEIGNMSFIFIYFAETEPAASSTRVLLTKKKSQSEKKYLEDKEREKMIIIEEYIEQFYVNAHLL